MSFSKLLEKLLKNSGSGPETKDEIISKDITIQPWSATHNYPIGSLIRMGGGLICFAKQASGPDSPVGSQDPSLDSEHQYWSVVSTDDGNVVHKDGDEDIGGEKYFYNTGGSLDEDGIISALSIYSPDLTKGVVPTTGKRAVDLNFLGNQTDIDWRTNLDNRLGYIRYTSSSTGFSTITIHCYDPNRKTENLGTALIVGYDEAGIAYSKASSTKLERNETSGSGNDILTRDWIPKDTRIVHTTGNEDIGGEKTFTGNNWVYNTGPAVMLRNKNWSHTAAPSANRFVQFSAYSEDDNREGRLLFYKNTDGATGITLEIVRNNATTTAGFGLGVNSSGVHWSNVGSNVTQFVPGTTNKTTLGTSSQRWKEIWCNQSSINTSSDERIKSNIKSIPDNVLDAWGNINWIEFQYNDAISEKGENARLHTGLIAQRVASAFEQANVAVDKYGFYLFDKWDSEEAILDDEGKEIKPAVEAGEMYGIRYTEALCIEAAYNRREVKRLKERLARLEEQLAK